jgi:hypothetical protein
LCFSLAEAQKQGNIWYFGLNAGLDFNSGSPVALTDGQLFTDEGCATICDKNGKLLFYTDGTNVWNNLHQYMPNGFDLLGNPSSTQSAVIVPFPADTTKYYVFTVPALAGPDGLNYSVVDLTEDKGKGDITIKNIHLENSVCEKLTAVNHANGQDIWVIAHLWKSNKFVAYLVTDKGINKPVYTSIGPYYGDDASNAIGYLKASPDGKRLASVRYFYYGAECQVYDFDNKSGKIYNPILIDSVKKGYGVEFSPDSRLLYVGHDSHRGGICKIFQYDLGQADTSKIKRNGYLVVAGLESTGALQLGPDKKIYIAQNFVTYLHTIESPNERGSKCNFVLNSTPLGGEFSTLGLPTFIQSYFEPKTDFTCQNSCVGNICQFKTFSKLKPDKWHWNFGDSTSGSNNISYLQNANHIFTTSGKYRVKLIITSGSFTDTVEKEITVYKMPIANLGADIIVCDTLPITLFAGEAEHYNWSTGDTIKQISVAKNGAYWVKLKNGSCTATDTINVTFLQEKDFEIGNDTIICAGESIVLKNNIPNAKYMWSTGSQDSSIRVNKSGKYWLATLIND